MTTNTVNTTGVIVIQKKTCAESSRSSMINLKPKTCNLCGGKVVLIPNSQIYGKSYGSGFCYFCTECGAYVGTHTRRPFEAMGILADRDMRQMKMKCHEIFDQKWKGKKHKHHARDLAYQRLAKKMKIDVADCHFGYMDMEQLNIAYKILVGDSNEEGDSLY